MNKVMAIVILAAALIAVGLVMSKRNQKRILGICATALAFFGGKFIYSSAMAWFALANTAV